MKLKYQTKPIVGGFDGKIKSKAARHRKTPPKRYGCISIETTTRPNFADELSEYLGAIKPLSEEEFHFWTGQARNWEVLVLPASRAEKAVYHTLMANRNKHFTVKQLARTTGFSTDLIQYSLNHLLNRGISNLPTTK